MSFLREPAERLLEAAARARRVAPAGLTEGASALVVVAPHPDDETLGAGALLHDAARLGLPCRVICLTDGARSHPRSRHDLRAIRAAELEAAVADLAPGAGLHQLRHPDCGLPAPEPLAAEVAPLLPKGALVLCTWAGDPHGDHQAASAALRLAAAERPDLRLLEYPIWGRFDAAARPPALLSLDASAEALAAKRRALARHVSQMTRLIEDDPEGFVMEPAHQDHFLTHPELFLAP